MLLRRRAGTLDRFFTEARCATRHRGLASVGIRDRLPVRLSILPAIHVTGDDLGSR